MAPKILLAFLLVAAASGSSLRSAPVKTLSPNAVAPAAPVPVKAAKASDDSAQVAQLRTKLGKISGGLAKMLRGPPNKVTEIVGKFQVELQSVLKETEKPKDLQKALKQLQDAQAGVQVLSKEISDEGTRVMQEGDAQEISLLIGVLMRRQKAPLSEQMEVLKSAEFAKLAVVKAVLAAKDVKTPLFQQVAAYEDKHSPKPVAAPKEPEIPDKLKVGKDGKPDVTPIVNALQVRLNKMEDNENRMEHHHQAEMKELERVLAEKKNKKSKRAQSTIKQMEHREERQFKKESALGKHDIQSIKSAIDAVKKGDMAALDKAQGALSASMKAAQSRSGKFLVLIQTIQSAQELDCPYCAAQCVDKCHTEGKPYTTCLTVCADAGK